MKLQGLSRQVARTMMAIAFGVSLLQRITLKTDPGYADHSPKGKPQAMDVAGLQAQLAAIVAQDKEARVVVAGDRAAPYQKIMDAIDDEMVEEAVEAVDAVVLWWREDDGDVVDGFVDSLTDLSSTGVIWLLTPKVGRPGGTFDAPGASRASSGHGKTPAGLRLGRLPRGSGCVHVVPWGRL